MQGNGPIADAATSTGGRPVARSVVPNKASATAQCSPAVRPRIYLAANAAPSKVAALQRAGADITSHGRDVVEAEVEARRVAGRDGAVYCSPYNDLKVPMATMAGLLSHWAAAVCGACRLQGIKTLHNVEHCSVAMLMHMLLHIFCYCITSGWGV